MVCSVHATVEPTCVQAQTAKKPNILVIWGDDIGIENISYYNRGMMGFETANRVVPLAALPSSMVPFRSAPA